ncbi:MAG: hypothetical protein JSV03_03335, partial [Planctomycetota bacterium]
YPLPKAKTGNVTGPLPHQLFEDGEWRVMVAAYRRFLDTLLYQKYSAARRLVRSVDPHHLVSYRMSDAGDPTNNEDKGFVPYDFPYLAAAVDFLAPEAYGRLGDWERVKPGWFEYEYARWAAPDKPMIWSEAGISAWDSCYQQSLEGWLLYQAEFYKHMYRMIINSGADGVFFWWYPGGYRYNEQSDYGIINPDASDRPVTKVIREYGPKLIEGPSALPVDHWIEFDRDAQADGLPGAYDKVKDEFWKMIDAGRVPGLKTAGTGTNSANCPLLAVGDTECNGSNPPKYLDGIFDSVEVKGPDGKWIVVHKGGKVKIDPAHPVVARVELINLGEAEWLAPTKKGTNQGAVYITALGPKEIRTKLTAPVKHHQSIKDEKVALAPPGLKKPTLVTLSLQADGRTPFGEKFTIKLVP